MSSLILYFGHTCSILTFKISKNYGIFSDDNIIEITGFCVPDGLPSGTGRKMMSKIQEIANLLDISKLIVFPIDEAKLFYKKIGFKDIDPENPTGYVFFDINIADKLGKLHNRLQYVGFHDRASRTRIGPTTSIQHFFKGMKQKVWSRHIASFAKGKNKKKGTRKHIPKGKF